MLSLKIRKIITLVVLSSFIFTAFQLPLIAQEVMSSGAYKIQSDSVNFAGGRSSSNSYGLEDTAGEIATGKVVSSNFGADVGYQAMIILVAGDTTAPSAPPSISATTLTSTSIEVIWGESTDNVAVTRYYIYRDGNRVADVATFPRSFADTGLTPNTTYSYNVSAADDAGNESLWSATTTATTFSSPISGGGSNVFPIVYDLSIVPTESKALITFKTTTYTKATLSWGTDGNYTSGNVSNSNLLDLHSFVLNNLKSGTEYNLKISLVRADGHVVVYDGIIFSTTQLPRIVLPPNPTKFSATAGENDISLSWKMPADPSIVGITIVRSRDFYPSTPDDGEIIFQGLGESWSDASVEKNVKYYYSAFTKDVAGNYSSGVVANARILLPGEEVVPTEPFDDISLVGEVDPLIAGLELKDFLFIQNGEILKVVRDSVTIDGTKNLAVALRAYKVPPVLKTIAVTLVTPGDDPKSFTFILRANKDNTRYEAVVAPLGETTVYNLRITVIDFKNQGLKKLKGTMLVLSEQAKFILSEDARRFFGYSFLLLLLALLILYFDRRKNKNEPIPATA